MGKEYKRKKYIYLFENIVAFEYHGLSQRIITQKEKEIIKQKRQPKYDARNFY